MKQQLLNKVNNKSAVVGIIGLGYVGLPLLLRFVEVGFRVIGFDIDPAKIEKLSGGKSYLKHIDAERVAYAAKSGLFEGTTDFGRAGDADALIICVPTPLDRHRSPDLSFIVKSIEAILPHLRPGQVISLESTTYPGTTDEVLRHRIESRGFAVGKDLFLVYSPEREDPGNTVYTTSTIPKVCGGTTPDCLQIGIALYGQIINRIVPVSSTRTAEMSKLLENIHRAVNIGLVNELKIVCDAMNIDLLEVIDAASSKPFGFTPYYPGPGLGGHCIPIDPFYLTWKAREFGLFTRFIELAGEINTAMPDWVIGKIVHSLSERRIALKNARVLVLGIAYKKNIDDMRESPSAVLIDKLIKKGAVVDYSDPFIPSFPKMKRYHFDLQSIEINASNIKSYDCVLVATDHDAFDYRLIQEHAKLIVDTRGVYRENNSKVVMA